MAMNSTEVSLECVQIPNPLREAEALQYRPARWVQTIATDFFPRKSFPLENERVQTS